MTILTHIQTLLEEKDYHGVLQMASEDVPYDRLLVVLQSPESGKENLLEITAHPQMFEGKFTTENVEDAYHLLQFQFVLPVEVTPLTFNQVSSALHFFNRLLHCPGFELDELNDQIVYRHVWFIKKKGIDSFLLMQVIGNLHLCLNMFSPYIKEIAEGKYTLEDILKQVSALSHHQTKKNLAEEPQPRSSSAPPS